VKPLRLAIVVQRYGLEVLGGSEDAARTLAEHLTALGEVHVITTCATHYTTWAPVYPSGVSELNGVTVHRFPVDQPRDWERAIAVDGRFWQEQHTLDQEMDWIRQNGPYSSALFRFIYQSEPDFDLFIFFTYLYATTFFGLPLVAQKAIFVPTAHDEPFLRADAYRILFHLPRHVVYLTDAERAIVHLVTGNGRVPHTTTAFGFAPPEDVSGDRFRQKYGLTGDFLLYGGRISVAKNVPQLLDYFQQYRQAYGHEDANLKLVLMGSPDFVLPSHPDIIPIGFVSEQDKFDALQAATAVIQPSRYESLSIIILQAWLVGTAVMVNSQCTVTRQQCQRSNGGLYYSSYDEFAAIVNRLQGTPSLRAALGRQGQRFVQTTYNWDAILSQYQAIFMEVLS
jgi:glycosyltransferase involved in cell wall biosynthesis